MAPGTCPTALAAAVLALALPSQVKHALTAVMMWWYPLSRDMQIWGCSQARSVGSSDPLGKEVLAALGILELAVRAVRNFPDDAEVAKGCINGVALLSLFNAHTSALAGAKGIHALAMQAHSKWAAFNAEFLFGNEFGCFQDDCVENRERFAAAGAIPALLKHCGIGGAYYWNQQAQWSCWCALSSFHTRRGHLEFIENGGLESAVAVYRDHAQSHPIREGVLQALNGVVCYNRTTRAALFRLGIIDALLGSMREQWGNPKALALAARALTNMARTDAAYRAAAVRWGAVDVLLEALMEHPRMRGSPNVESEDPEAGRYNVPGEVSSLLSYLALHGEEAQDAMLRGGAIALVSVAIGVAERSRHRKALVAGCAMLRNLAPAVSRHQDWRGVWEVALAANNCSRQGVPAEVPLLGDGEQDYYACADLHDDE